MRWRLSCAIGPENSVANRLTQVAKRRLEESAAREENCNSNHHQNHHKEQAFEQSAEESAHVKPLVNAGCRSQNWLHFELKTTDRAATQRAAGRLKCDLVPASGANRGRRIHCVNGE